MNNKKTKKPKKLERWKKTSHSKARHIKTAWSDKDVRNMRRMWSSGVPTADIAQRLSRTPAEVRCKVHNLRKRSLRQGLPVDDLPKRPYYKANSLTQEQRRAIVEDGRSPRELAAVYETSDVTIRAIRKRAREQAEAHA